MPGPVKIFISYAHKDSAYLKEIGKLLSELSRLKLIEYWDDYLIVPGREWNEIIAAQICEARVFILLISQHFFASQYIRDNELPVILEKCEQNKDVVMPQSC
jgi:hypothetical protein